jgi:DNA polymerase III delta subunit
MAKPFPFHVAYGEDTFMLGRHLAFGRSFRNRDIIQLDGAVVGEEELVSACESFSLGGQDRVVVLDNAQKVKGKELSRYIEEKERKDLATILVAVVRAKSLPDPWSKLGSKGQTVCFQELKPWSEEPAKKLMAEEAERLGIKLSVEVPGILWRSLGNNSGRICNELGKLSVLVGPRGTVKKEHLKLVLSAIPSVDSYQATQLAEAAFSFKVNTAMKKASSLYKHQGEGVSVPIVSALMKQAERYYVARRMLDSGDTVGIVAHRFGMGGSREFFFKRDVLPSVQKRTAVSLLKQMKFLCELDVKVKGPAHSKRSLVELAVLSITS